MPQLRNFALPFLLVFGSLGCQAVDDTNMHHDRSTVTEPVELETLHAAIRDRGAARVVVLLSTDAEEPNPAQIKKVQDALIDELSTLNFALIRRFTQTPLLALTVDADALKRLLESDRVRRITPDRLAAPSATVVR